MKTKNSFNIILLVFLLITVVNCGSYNEKHVKSSDVKRIAIEKKPNIVVILADDLGYGDVGYHGSDIQTPNIDKLAKEGIKLESFYVAPMCSPTRAGLLTGRYPIRFGMMRAVLPPSRNYGVDPNEDMLPEMLQRAGYKYRAAIGKWHLGNMEDKWLPNNQGFTHFVGCYEGAIDYFTHFRGDKLDWHKNGELYNQEGYSTDLIAQESVEFINNVPKDEPYFLYVPFNAPHSPFQAKESDIAKYPNRKGNKKTYAAMVDCMDQGIGKIMQAIQARGDLENTFILFMSDNGGVKSVGDNSPMTGFKLTPYEGGIRVAAVAYWKGHNITGEKTINDRVGYIDIFPTLKEVAGLQESEVNPLDGSSILGLLKGNGTIPKRDWYTYMDQDGKRRQELAVHSGDWKVVIEKDAPDALENREPVEELYDLSGSHIERENLKNSKLKIYSELSAKLDGFLKLIRDDQVPRYGEEKDE
jgi:arylsulfatase A-like enzyme